MMCCVQEILEKEVEDIDLERFILDVLDHYLVLRNLLDCMTEASIKDLPTLEKFLPWQHFDSVKD